MNHTTPFKFLCVLAKTECSTIFKYNVWKHYSIIDHWLRGPVPVGPLYNLKEGLA